MSVRDGRGGWVLLAAAGLLLAYGVVRVVQPLVPVLAAAAAVAVVIHPLHERVLARMPGRPGAAAALASAAACLLLAVPLAVGGLYLVHEAVRAYPLLRDQAQALAVPAESAPAWLPEKARGYLQELDLRELLLANIREVGAWSGRFVGSAAGTAANAALDGLVFVASLFLFLRGGRRTLERLVAAVPLESRDKARIVARTRDMIVAAVEGVFAVAVVQGVLSAAGFAILGVPFPVLLGALCMLFSPIPFLGPMIVWIPVAARLALGGEPGRAAGIALWFALIVGTSDNLLRPFLVGARSRMPAPIVVVGVLGGLRAFGAAGLFLGPIILAIGVAAADALLLDPAHERS